MADKEIADIELRMAAMHGFMINMLNMHKTLLTHFSEISTRLCVLEQEKQEKSKVTRLAETATIMKQELIEERLEEMQRDMQVLHTTMTTILKTTGKTKE